MADGETDKKRGEAAAERRGERSRAALRANLQRRKAQVRGRRDEAGERPPTHDSAGFEPEIVPDEPRR